MPTLGEQIQKVITNYTAHVLWAGPALATHVNPKVGSLCPIVQVTILRQQ